MSANKKLKLLVKRLAFLTPILFLGISLSSGIAYASSPGYAATNVLGQTDGSGNPSFTTDTTDNGKSPIDGTSMDYPEGTAIDLVHHRLFVADCGNNRVLVFNLDNSNNPTSTAANYVLGQTSLSGSNQGSGNSGMNCPEDPTYDPADNWLFVADTGSSRSRILVYDLSNGITDGMPASYELGQSSFAGGGCDYQGSPTAYDMCDAYGGLAYDTVHHRLFVGDAGNNRILVFNMTNGITSGMPASYAIGQPSTNSDGCSSISATTMGEPFGIVYDAAHNRLFVGDEGNCSSTVVARVDVYNMNNLATGMAASYALGQPDLQTGGIRSPAANVIANPEDLIYDSTDQELFVQDDTYNRILVFDVSSITDNENAIAVLGQPDFTSDDYSCATSQTDMCDAEGVDDSFDPVNHRLYLSDAGDDRILIFNFVNITTPAGLLKSATAGTSYSQTFQTTNSQGTVTFAVTGGSLPPGLNLNASNGVINGTPTTSGTYTFEITAYDNNGTVGTFEDDPSYTITVGSGASIGSSSSAFPPDTGYGKPVNHTAVYAIFTVSFVSIIIGSSKLLIKKKHLSK